MIINPTIAGGGTQPTGTTNITGNGIHNVAQYEYADVQVPTTAPAHYIERINDNGTLTSIQATLNAIDLTGITTIDERALSYMYYRAGASTPFPNFSSVTTIKDYGLSHFMEKSIQNIDVDLSHITTVYTYGLDNAFFQCYIKSLDLSGLTTLYKQFSSSGYHLSNICTSSTLLQSVDISNLEIVDAQNAFNYSFNGCSGLQTANLSKLKIVNTPGSVVFTRTFYTCSSLTNVMMQNLQYHLANFDYTFNSCRSLSTNPLTGLRYYNGGYMFSSCFNSCTGMTDGSFPKLEICITGTGGGNNAFAACTSLTKQDFPCLVNATAGTSNAMFKTWYGTSGVVPIPTMKFPMLQVFNNNVFDATSFSRATGLTIHFRMDAQTAVSAQTGYSSNFGASALAFDLVGTITVNGTDYIREEVASQTGYTAWHKKASTITVGGVTYTFDQTKIDCWHPTNGNDFSIVYAWTDGNTTIYTDKLIPDVGDFIYTSMTAAQSATDSVSAVSTEMLYTDDSAEAQVGDNVYSDAGVTLVGTVSAIA